MIIDFVAILVARRQPKSVVKKLVNEKFFKDDPVTSRTIENYLARARELIAEISGKSRDQHRIDAVAFYDSVITGPDADLRERMVAMEGLRELLNLDEPKMTKHELTGKDGGPVEILALSTAEQAAVLAELHDAIQVSVINRAALPVLNGQVNGDGHEANGHHETNGDGHGSA